jgi:site-specific recombinase XerD
VPSKQVVAGSSPVSRSTIYAQNSCELFTKKFTKELRDSFLSSRATGTSPKTIAVYHVALDRFIGYPLTPEGINAYLNSLTCGNAKHNYYRCIRTLCKWLYQSDQITTNPIERVLPPRRQKKMLPAITEEQLTILVNNAVAERDKVILLLLWHSGMRLSEVANVKANDFNWQEGTVVVLGKGNRYRKALAGNDVVREWFSKHDSLELNAHGIQTMLHRLEQATGIKCNAHSFRRGFCVHNVKSGLSNKVIQALGGWETPSMVSHYAASLTFNDALALYRAINETSSIGSVEIQ